MLSERENQVIKLLSKGLSNKDIAVALSLSPFTVKRHIENIYHKLKIHNRVELLEKARKSKMI